MFVGATDTTEFVRTVAKALDLDNALVDRVINEEEDYVYNYLAQAIGVVSWKRFAVVADEVRKLAEQSSVAAGNIADLIHNIQRETAEAVKSISSGTEGVNEGVDAVSTAADAFKNIGVQVEKLTVNVANSTTGIEEVNKANDDIANAFNHTREVTQKSNETATSISAVAEEQTAMINEISESSKTLAQLADEMQNVVSTFKL